MFDGNFKKKKSCYAGKEKGADKTQKLAERKNKANERYQPPSIDSCLGKK